ncbi:AAA family ATPase [Rossellomorea marisflavi]|uniref:AAA family ATPase n=1 Tax=Rossellomorea marisflavi TaxID=189381 RepID=UPI003D2F4BB7
MEIEKRTRLRVVSINELQFLISLKNGLWGSNNSHLNNWIIDDRIVFIVNKEIVGLAKVAGEPYYSDEAIWTNGKFPYRLPLKFEVVLHSSNRIAVDGKIKYYIKNEWDNYGIPIRFKLLIPTKSAEKLLDYIYKQENSIIYYYNNIDRFLNKHNASIPHTGDESGDVLPDESTNGESIKLSRLYLSNWRQFDTVDIDFHKNLTILTGANGTGKTTLLNLINYHFGWETEFVNTEKLSDSITDSEELERKIGLLAYSNKKEAKIKYPIVSTYTYGLELEEMQEVRGLYIPSHRSKFGFKEVETIPTRVKPLEKLFTEYTDKIKNDYALEGNEIKPNYILKESLISLAMFGYGNDVIKPNIISLEMFNEFKRVLKQVLPPKLGFNDISIILPDVIFETDSGSFQIDAVSGGIAAIIDLSWQIFLHHKIKDKLVVTIDEPENHLHPEMQRLLMPNLIKAFPNVQFIIITHNPFIISSVKDSNIFILNYNENKKVETTKLDFINKAGTSNDILREALGIPVTMPIWVEKKLKEIVESFTDLDLTKENIIKIRNEMNDIGLEEYIPTTIVDIINQVKKND